MTTKPSSSKMNDNEGGCESNELFGPTTARQSANVDPHHSDFAHNASWQVSDDDALFDEWEIELSTAEPFKESERDRSDWDIPGDRSSVAKPTGSADRQSVDQTPQPQETRESDEWRIGSGFRWSRYGPILVFVMGLAFFVLPTFLTTPVVQSSWRQDPGSLDAYIGLRAQTQKQSTSLNAVRATAGDEQPDIPAELEASELAFLEGITVAELRPTAAGSASTEALSTSDLTQQVTAIQTQLNSQLQLLEQVLAGQSAQKAVASAALGQRGDRVDLPFKATATGLDGVNDSVYVLDTTNPPKPHLNAFSGTAQPSHSTSDIVESEHLRVGAVEHAYSAVVLHSIVGDYLNFVAMDCARSSYKIGDAIAGFGVIVAVRGSRVYSHTNHYISRGHFRQCSRSVLIGQEADSLASTELHAVLPVMRIK